MVPGLPIPPEACTRGISREGKKRGQPARFRPGFFPSLPGWTQGLAHSRNHGGGRFLVSEHKSLSHFTSDDGARELSCNDSLTGSVVTSKGVRFFVSFTRSDGVWCRFRFFRPGNVHDQDVFNGSICISCSVHVPFPVHPVPDRNSPVYTSMKSLWAQEHIPDIHLLITSTRIHRSDKHPFPGSCA